MVAVIVNFLGYIPPGNINLTAVSISVNKGFKQALVFAITFSIVEAVFTYFLMRFAQWFAAKEVLIFWLDWLLIIIFVLLGINSLKSSKKENIPTENSRKRDSIKTGIILGIFNPVQIPFWLIAGSYLIANEWITTKGIGLEIFALGAALGAFCSLYLFARFANYTQNKFSLSKHSINKYIAGMFFLLALIQLFRQFYRIW